MALMVLVLTWTAAKSMTRAQAGGPVAARTVRYHPDLNRIARRTAPCATTQHHRSRERPRRQSRVVRQRREKVSVPEILEPFCASWRMTQVVRRRPTTLPWSAHPPADRSPRKHAAELRGGLKLLSREGHGGHRKGLWTAGSQEIVTERRYLGSMPASKPSSNPWISVPQDVKLRLMRQLWSRVHA
jgi:hypothetical protein